jgi:iron(II)-dependent oxidoreductase
VTGVQKEGKDFSFTTPLPLFSFTINGESHHSPDFQLVSEGGDALRYQLGELGIAIHQLTGNPANGHYELVFANNSTADTMILENIVPLGTDSNHVYITGKGKHPLSRTHLFRPGRAPVNVIVPDNAWELGYAGIGTEGNTGLCALSRRRSWDNERARRRRFETILNPGGSVTYHLWFEGYTGDWQAGLRRIFQDNYLYDLEGRRFDETLYQREDLQWIRHAYAMHILMAWDRDFYNPTTQSYQLEALLQKAERLYGGDDVIGIWPSWPMLGLDQRNQWDLFRDLPGGTARLQELATMCRQRGARFFISYNPWDESTRWEDHHAGMSDMIRAVTADGVVLDTEGKSSREHQAAADEVRPGVIMYSEGMAVPKDMPGIVAGRVHNALYFPPPLNLNKFIRPDFAIFRVAELYKERIRREYAVSFFNGYGTEINQFRPGRPEWIDEDYRFWGQTLSILRDNTSNFNAWNFKPLIDTYCDSIYVNEWPLEQKNIFTILSFVPEGFRGPLFRTDIREGHHLVNLWNHELIGPDTAGSQWIVPVNLEGFSNRWLGTNNEGAVGAVAVLPQLLSIQIKGDFLTMEASRGEEIRLWAGAPSYQKDPVVFGIEKRTVKLLETLGRREGKFVVKLFEKGELLDEQVFEIPPGTARMISKVEQTPLPPPLRREWFTSPQGPLP